MFKIFEILKGVKKEVIPKDDIYTVHESTEYYFEFFSENLVDSLIFIEDVPVRDDYVQLLNNNLIRTRPYRFFEDYFGFANISINGTQFQVNILIEKLKISEIEDIILYLFENNHTILDKFISKSFYSGKSVYNGKEYMFSSKYLNLVEDFCNVFDQLFVSFRNVPHTVVRKSFKLASYENEVINFKSIEWLLQNLDSVYFSKAYSDHPHRIEISNKFGLLDKIGCEQNELSYCTYENEIILGCFVFIIEKLNSIKAIIAKKLTEVTPKTDSLEEGFADFRNFKKLPFLRLQSNLINTELRIKSLFQKFRFLFKHVKPHNGFPKLTPVFSKVKHYQKAFEIIRIIRISEYDLEGQIQLLNVRKLSELYELYNLSIIIEEMKIMFGNSDIFDLDTSFTSKDDVIVSKLSFRNKFTNYSYTLFYEPRIKRNSDETDLIMIGNSSLNINASYCNPDFVIEVVSGVDKVYHILDAKYTKINTLENIHKPTCIKKYLIDVGIKGMPYQKANNLVLLHPDSTDKEKNLIHNTEYYPQILSMVCKPKSDFKLRQLVRSFK